MYQWQARIIEIPGFSTELVRPLWEYGYRGEQESTMTKDNDGETLDIPGKSGLSERKKITKLSDTKPL